MLDRGGVITEIGDLLLVRGDPTARIDAVADVVGIWRGGASVQRCSYDE